ncbi:LapB repeat-containing protein [Listeria ilorinensis]|uniref:LapB repeat-containing protein n=1 Tax=Listeria ilorinensis TaxID=2867439 RepID=UPI001EF4AF5D|nr:LapB repeat-containing protein [Listeria ilorinensis]
MKKTLSRIILTSCIFFQVGIVTAAEENQKADKGSNDVVVTEPKNLLENESSTFAELFPDAALAEAVAEEATGSDDITQTVSMQQLEGITTLTATDKGIRDLTGIEYLTNLQKLNLSNNQITDITTIYSLQQLTYLDISGNQIGNISFTAESQMSNLATLSAYNNESQKVEIKDQPKLTQLNIEDGGKDVLEELDLEDLPKLDNVGMNGSGEGDNRIRLAGSTTLQKVTLKNLPLMRDVGLENDQLTEAVVKDMAVLIYLDLSGNQLNNVSQLTDLPLLATLDVSSNQISNLESIQELPKLSSLYLSKNHLSVLDKTMPDKLPLLTTLDASSQTITRPEIPAVNDLIIPNEISNFDKISTPTVISNNGIYSDSQVKWTFEQIKNLSSVNYKFNEPVNDASLQGTFSGTVTQPFRVSAVPSLTADSEITYPKNSQVTTEQFLTDIHAQASEGATIETDFLNVVDLTTAGDYKVTLAAKNEDGFESDPITVIVHVQKAAAPIINADSEITYPKNSTISEERFLTDIHARTDDGSAISSDFEAQVRLTEVGDYEVTLSAKNEDGVEAAPVTVTVHVAPLPAPVITASGEIHYEQNSEVSEEQFLTDIQATVSDGAVITTDFKTQVDFTTVGVYEVTLRAVNEDGLQAAPVTVKVYVDSAEAASVITADSEITYFQNSNVSEAQFLADVHAETSDGSVIVTDFSTQVDFSQLGDYQVTLSAHSLDGVAAKPVNVTVHIVDNPETKAVITADTEVTYDMDSNLSESQFLTDIHATVTSGGTITSDFEQKVQWGTPGDYLVTLHAVNADDVTVMVHLIDNRPVIPDNDNTPIPDNGPNVDTSAPNHQNAPADYMDDTSHDDTDAVVDDQTESGDVKEKILPKTGDSDTSAMLWGLLLVAGTILYLKKR